MIKFPYITSNEITHEQVNELIERCKNITYTPAYRTFKEVENVSF